MDLKAMFRHQEVVKAMDFVDECLKEVSSRELKWDDVFSNPQYKRVEFVANIPHLNTVTATEQEFAFRRLLIDEIESYLRKITNQLGKPICNKSAGTTAWVFNVPAFINNQPNV